MVRRHQCQLGCHPGAPSYMLDTATENVLGKSVVCRLDWF
jgi:hypothetical protein